MWFNEKIQNWIFLCVRTIVVENNNYIQRIINNRAITALFFFLKPKWFQLKRSLGTKSYHINSNISTASRQNVSRGRLLMKILC